MPGRRHAGFLVHILTASGAALALLALASFESVAPLPGTARELAARAKQRFPVGSPGWVRADDIVAFNKNMSQNPLRR